MPINEQNLPAADATDKQSRNECISDLQNENKEEEITAAVQVGNSDDGSSSRGYYGKKLNQGRQQGRYPHK